MKGKAKGIGGRTLSALLCAAAVSLLACTAAYAAEYEVHSLPEFGRCTHVGAGGVYTGSHCIAVNTKGKGAYDWTALSEADSFSATGGATTLATSEHTVKCTSFAISGEATSAKKVTATVELGGCTNQLGKQCQGLTEAKGVIKSGTLEGELGFIRNEPKGRGTVAVVGLDLKPQTPFPSLATYECGSVTETAAIEGSVIAGIKPIDKSASEVKLAYSVSKAGKQVPEKFQGEPADTLSTTFTNDVLTKTTEPSTLKVTKLVVGHFTSALEIKAKETG